MTASPMAIVRAVAAALSGQGLPDGDRIAATAAGAALRAAAAVWEQYADRIAAAGTTNLGQQWHRDEAVLEAKQTAAALRELADDVNDSRVTGLFHCCHAHTGPCQTA